MSEEQNDQYLIYSDVFSSIQDKTKCGEFFKNSIQFFILLNEKRADINLVDDDDGDPDLCRPERIDLTLGIALFSFIMNQKCCRQFCVVPLKLE
ncbi:unnamed protein product [Rotaria magnacalcarata]|uniref:Uncharacterized protein n=1 Tax=Rotaria magnacalcarata TaxID=392030 RepID=A0A820U6K7_9BILA|nr:unnamed protein product [Rotaria magnacalcarata]